MKIPALEIIIPGADPHTTIESAIQAAKVSPGAIIWIPANYIGPDSNRFDYNYGTVPVLDFRSGGTITCNKFYASGSTIVTQTVASGTATLGTAAIGSGAKATIVSVAATGVLATDTVLADFNADPTAVIGYIPSTSGILTILKFPSAGQVNFQVINNTGASITPGPITLNWRVVR